MKVLPLLLCTILFYCCLKSERFRPALQSKIDKLCLEKELGFNDSTSKVFLYDSASREELLKLLDHRSPIIRIISYRALVNRNDKDFFEILKDRLKDTAKVMWWYFDDAGGEFKVADIMIRKVERKLSRAQKDSLIGWVLLHHNYLKSSHWMIQEIKPDQKFYPLIESRAIDPSETCGVQMGATYALAKFKKQEDIELMKRNLMRSDEICTRWIFKTIEVFPDSAFYPVLSNYLENQIKKKKQYGSDDLKYYCRALAQYKNETSLSILLALTRKETYPDNWYFSYNQDHIFQAIHKYYSPLYDKLYKNLKPQVSDYIFKYLDKPDYDDYTTW